MPIILSDVEAQRWLHSSFSRLLKKRIVVIDNKYQIKEFNANINGREVSFEMATSLVPFNRMCRIDIFKLCQTRSEQNYFLFP